MASSASLSSPDAGSSEIAITASSISSSLKKTKGRQKVEMVLMENESNRLVTFSKRRSGLFKKASELCTLCGSEAAIIVFSPARKVYSFGNPSVDDALKRFGLSISASPLEKNNEILFEVAQQSDSIGDLNALLEFVNSQIEIEQKTSEWINGIKKANEQVYWWDRAEVEFSYHHLVCLKYALEVLKNDVIQYGKNRYMLEALNPANRFPKMGINHPKLGCFDGVVPNPNGCFIGYRHD